LAIVNLPSKRSFRVILGQKAPAQAVPIPPSADAEEAAMAEQQGKRVMLVEDEPVLQKLISGYLVSAGYIVQTAVDGLDAIGKLRAGLPDLIISDLNMPRMSGTEFLDVVRKRFPQIPVMLISDHAPDALPGGVTADAYFQKNKFGFHQLPETISDLTGKPHLRTTLPPVENEPAQARLDGSGNHIIRCADCLREFCVPRLFHLEGAMNWTGCIHCGKMFQY
jgi:CheY-like chemotaxis protein